ncbi:type I secretion target [Pseudomonas marginalis ICMP 9505]|nr:type I secretion target [Pseudomonas marginalis ICMP 9505]
MLSPLAHSAPTQPHYNASTEPNRPKPSPYDPPSDLEPWGLSVRLHPLLEKSDVKISREIAWDTADPEKPKIVSNRLVVETGDNADHIHVRSWPGEKLQFIVNGKSYVVDAKAKDGTEQGLFINARGGNDTVIVDDDVKLALDVDGGDGDDHLQAGGGRSRLYGQSGNDLIRLGSGIGYAEGNDGDDTIINGKGNAVIYGNKGNDRLYAGFGAPTKQTYLDGGDGKDWLYAGSGHTVLHGGNDDDHLIGHDSTTFYTGEGNDHVMRNLRKDRIDAGANDHFDRTQGSAYTEVKPSNAGENGFTVAEKEGASG